MNLHTSYDPATRIWSGLPVRPLYNPNASVADVLFASLRRRPSHIGQISDTDGTRLTNGELLQLSVRVALHLGGAEVGLRKGDVVAMVVRNHRLVAPVLLGCVALAAPVNTLDADFKADEIAQMLRLTKPKIVFCDALCVPAVSEALVKIDKNSPVVLYTVDKRVDGVKCAEDLIVSAGNADEEERFVPTDVGDGTKHVAVIVCSSGTTGPSKGVSISHALLLHQMTGICELTDDDVFFTFSSLYWLSGLATLIAGTMHGITRIISAAPFTPTLMLRIIAQHRVTVTLTAPSYLAQLLQSDQVSSQALSSLQNYFCGGSAVAPQLVQRIDRVLPQPLRVCYGLSEVAGVVTANRSEGRTVSGSAGVLKAGLRVQLLRAADGKRCEPNENGEICVHSDVPMLGYWGNAKATRETIDADGWLHTGDVGHFDEQGNLFIVDRMKDILKYRNVQISPSELEDVVLELAGVAEVCVVGVPEGVGSDLPAAVVVRRQDEAGRRLTVAEVEAIVAERLRDEKRLRGGVYFVERLPVTPSGKVVRREVREMATRMFEAK